MTRAPDETTPAWARALLARLAPPGQAEEVVGDLEEVHRARVARVGRARAAVVTALDALDVTRALLLERRRVWWRGRRAPRGAGAEHPVARAVRASRLDLVLGLRMLRKHPGLSLVAVIGMALAIAIGAGAFSLGTSLLTTELPLPGGDRVVALRNAAVAEPGRDRTSLRDFVAWRDALPSVRELAAFTTVSRTLVVSSADVDLVEVARITASGFRVARTAPVLGRALLEEDERSDARVVVVAHEEWQRRFAADPHVVGRHVRLGGDDYTIVGVMPPGFRFPVAHRYWIPLHVGAAERARPEAVALTVFGRLADGATVERAQTELAVLGSRLAAAYPDTHARMRPRVVWYTRAILDVDSAESFWTVQLLRFFVSLLLVVVAVNVAILVYARTATRAGEIAVRTALGASRARVVCQLFVEALVLSGTAALVGLTVAGVTLGRLQAFTQQAAIQRRIGALPFWLELGLAPSVVVYALGLTMVGAAIVGVVPALQATGGRVRAGLQRFSGHGARMQLGRAWTALIVGQVAIAVALLPFAAHFAEETLADGTQPPGYPAEEFLEASLSAERADGARDGSAAGGPAAAQRFRTRAAELLRRIEGDPAVAGVTVRLSEEYQRIEVETPAAADAAQRGITGGGGRIQPVGVGYFALHDMPIVSGRGFADADARAGATAVVVNETFAGDWPGPGPLLGRRLRLVGESDAGGERAPGPWLEIVGVVRDHVELEYEPAGTIYRPADVAALSEPALLAVRLRVRPATSYAPRLRQLAAAVDPTLQLDGVMSAADRHWQLRQVPRSLGIGTTVAMLSVLLLSAAGIYAMMAFTVTRRRREIGIRAALGAEPRRVLGSVFARASAQLAAGVALGTIGTVVLDRAAGRGPVHDGNAGVLLVVVALMTVVGLLAALGPARRGLAVQPTEALREE